MRCQPSGWKEMGGVHLVEDSGCLESKFMGTKFYLDKWDFTASILLKCIFRKAPRKPQNVNLGVLKSMTTGTFCSPFWGRLTEWVFPSPSGLSFICYYSTYHLQGVTWEILYPIYCLSTYLVPSTAVGTSGQTQVHVVRKTAIKTNNKRKLEKNPGTEGFN